MKLIEYMLNIAARVGNYISAICIVSDYILQEAGRIADSTVFYYFQILV